MVRTRVEVTKHYWASLNYELERLVNVRKPTAEILSVSQSTDEPNYFYVAYTWTEEYTE